MLIDGLIYCEILTRLLVWKTCQVTFKKWKLGNIIRIELRVY